MCSPPSCAIIQRPLLLHRPHLSVSLFICFPLIMAVSSGCHRKVCVPIFPFFSHTGYCLHQIRLQDIHQKFSCQMAMPDFSLGFPQFLKFLFLSLTLSLARIKSSSVRRFCISRCHFIIKRLALLKSAFCLSPVVRFCLAVPSGSISSV